MAKEGEFDPYDIVALEKAVNDSAVRVSAIWVTYLVFGLYLAIAVGNVTPRQLLIAQSVTLPVLNIALPLVGFFFLAPLLFVVLHAYVLLQLVLLARTASVYGEAIDRHFPIESDRERVRQRLANTLFAQLFAGSRREREGVLGALITIIAWLALVVGPFLLLFFFDIKFLTFHSNTATWCHRTLIAVDLLAVLLLWNAALNPRQDINLVNVARARRSLLLVVAIVLSVTTIFTFPTEFHAGWTRIAAARNAKGFGYSARPTVCDSTSVLFLVLPSHFDRLSLDGEQFVDQERLEKIESRNKGRSAFVGERSLDLSGRNLSCSNLRGSDLRRADLSDAILVGTHLDNANLQGVELDHANLQGATLINAKLQEADLDNAQVQGADLDGAQLHRASLKGTQFQGSILRVVHFDSADISGAQFQGAALDGAWFQGVALYHSAFQGASLIGARLQAALIKDVQLQGAVLDNAGLQGAFFQSSDVRGALFRNARLQGVTFTKDTKMSLSNFSHSYLWRTSGDCSEAQVSDPKLDPVIGFGYSRELIPATTEGLETEIELVTASLSESDKTSVAAALRDRLNPVGVDAKSAVVWEKCAQLSPAEQAYEKKRDNYLVEFACARNPSAQFIVEGLIFEAVVREDADTLQALATGMLGPNDELCPGALYVDNVVRNWLRAAKSGKFDELPGRIQRH